MPNAFRYRAFLSYSHKDKAWADWAHKALESFRLGSDLAGGATDAGIVPTTLRPIFRDRDDFSAGHSLTEQTREALATSHSMVVLCSPNSAASPYVNEEIRAFKALGREDRVFALIVDGEPGDPERECFAPALRLRVDPDGQLTDERLEPIAADARPEGDGKRTALVKVIAGLTGLPFNDIRKREVEEHKRQRLVRIALAASLAALSLGTGWFWWQGQQKEVQIIATQDVLKNMLEAVRSQGITLSADQQTALAATLGAATAQALAGDTLTAEALFLIKAGRVTEGIQKYKSAAENVERTTKDNKIVERYYRQLADLSRDIDPASSVAAYKKVIDLNNDDLGSIQFYAFSMKEQGNYEEAKKYAELLYSKSKIMKNSGAEYASLVLLGDIDIVKENHELALIHFNKASDVMRNKLENSPNDTFNQREYSVSLERIGDVQLEMGLFDSAINTQKKRHEIALSLNKHEPNNYRYKRDLLVSYTKLSESYIQLNKYGLARLNIGSAISLAKQILSQNIDSYQSNFDMSKVYNILGYIDEGESEIESAQVSFSFSLGYAKSAAKIYRTKSLEEITSDSEESLERTKKKLEAMKKRPKARARP